MARMDEIPILGRDLRYEAVGQEFLRVRRFFAVGTFEGRKVTGPAGLPYGMLEVDCPAALGIGPVKLPILHREDYRNVWTIYRDRGVGDDEEVLVIHDPLRFPLIWRIIGRLHLFAYPRGSLERIYAALATSSGKGMEGLPQPLEEWTPPGRSRLS